MRLRARLLLVNAALVPVVILGVWLGAAWLIREALARATEQALVTARAVLESVIHERVQRMELMTEPLAQDARVRGALATRGGRADTLKLGPSSAAARTRATDQYLASFMDEFSATRQDLMLLFGADGTLAYGEVGAGHHAGVATEVLSSRQLRALLGGLGTQPRGATMLWSGPRLREEYASLEEMKSPVYLAQAKRLEYSATGVSGRELDGLAILGTSDLDVGRLARARAAVVFTDGEDVLLHTLDKSGLPGHPDAEAGRVAAWLAQQPRPGSGDAARWQRVGEGEAALWVFPLELEELVPGPVRLAVVFANADVVALQARVQRRLTVGALALLVLVLGLGLWHVRSLSRPILELASAAGQVAAGQVKVRVSEARADELGDLARQFNRMVVGLEERERAQAALGRYLSPEMARELVRGPQLLDTAGVRRPLSLLFGDIAGFTSLCEERAPEDVVRLLNQHLDRLIPILFCHGAYIDKFEGDAIMAFWNAPLPQDDHAVRACAAALALDAAILGAAEGLRKQGLPRIEMRWGLNTGDAVVGNLGSSHKANYTAIGDAVNLASRLEAANKLYGTRILVGEGTWARAHPTFAFRELDRLRVKGRAGGVRVFELLGTRDGIAPERQPVLAAFAEGYAHYQAGRFEPARASFEAAHHASQERDVPSRVFAARCARYCAAPPPAGWDGVFTALSKDQENA